MELPVSPTSSSNSDTFDYHLAICPPVLSTNIPVPDHRPQRQRRQIPHPYARLFSKKDEVKRRKIWNHTLEKNVFSAFELSTVGAPQRRPIYVASLEAHIDKLHARLLELGLFPVDISELDPFKGLNFKTAKSMVSGLQHDATVSKLKLLELERANTDLEKILNTPAIPQGYSHGLYLPATLIGTGVSSF